MKMDEGEDEGEVAGAGEVMIVKVIIGYRTRM